MVQQESNQAINPVTLNNQGVLCLDKHEYKKAAIAFTRAAKHLMFLVNNNNNNGDNSNHDESTQRASNKRRRHRSLSSSEEETKPLAVMKQPSRKRARREEPQDEQEPRKKPLLQLLRNVTEATTTNNAMKITTETNRKNNKKDSCEAILGRPLWMKQPSSKKTSMVRPKTELAIVLYNLGLAFHHHALEEEQQQQHQGMLQRALSAYSMAKDLILMHNKNLHTCVLESPVLFVTLHNMARVFDVLGQQEKFASTTQQLATLLCVLRRRTRASFMAHSNNSRGYENFYLKLLSLPVRNDFASAA